MFLPKEYAQFMMEEKEIIQLDWVSWNKSSEMLELQPLNKIVYQCGKKKRKEKVPPRKETLKP